MKMRLLKMACLTVLLLRAAAAQTPNAEQDYYEQRVSIVGLQSPQTKLTATLEVPIEMPRAVLDIGGLEAAAPLKISLNGNVVRGGVERLDAEECFPHLAKCPAFRKV